ncbi:MAG TPA: hypothetical protein VGP85_06685 [Pyrinomonadaceae bacterium]|nr:hypothetical protein [Pyrinomonadaceae bacterium]
MKPRRFTGLEPGQDGPTYSSLLLNSTKTAAALHRRSLASLQTYFVIE